MTAAFYAWGHPSLGYLRPEIAEKPLTGFYNTVNEAAHEARGGIDLAMRKIGRSPVVDMLENIAVKISHGR